MVTKEFTITFRVEDNKMAIDGRNMGFTAHELVGLLEWKKQDILDQIKGKITPDVVKREYVQTDEETKTQEAADGQ